MAGYGEDVVLVVGDAGFLNAGAHHEREWRTTLTLRGALHALGLQGETLEAAGLGGQPEAGVKEGRAQADRSVTASLLDEHERWGRPSAGRVTGFTHRPPRP